MDSLRVNLNKTVLEERPLCGKSGRLRGIVVDWWLILYGVSGVRMNRHRHHLRNPYGEREGAKGIIGKGSSLWYHGDELGLGAAD